MSIFLNTGNCDICGLGECLWLSTLLSIAKYTNVHEEVC